MRLHFQTMGSGEPLIVLHGLFGSGDNWLAFARHFSARFHVMLPDARNHGHSPHAPEMNHEVMAADVCEFMAEQGIVSAHLLGHSMGGKTAMEFALSNGKQVRSLTVVDMAPRAYPPTHDQIIEMLRGLDLGKYRDRRQIESAMEETIPSRAVRQFLLKSLGRDAAGGFRWKMGLEEIRRNYRHLGEGLVGGRFWGGPCLFVRGESSNYVGDEDRAAILEFFPAAVVRTIPGAGHWVHTDAPESFQTVVGGFLK